jgi:hypothetical protein
MTERVRAQYESYPYPPRDPRDEAKRLIEGSPSHLLEINHYVFGGRRDFRRPFRALIAGGGTGDGTIMLAQHLADAAAGGDRLSRRLQCGARSPRRGRTSATSRTSLPQRRCSGCRRYLSRSTTSTRSVPPPARPRRQSAIRAR